MAFEYFLYDLNYNNTIIERSNTSFAPLPPDTGEIYIDYFIPNNQPLFYYRESGGTIVINDDQTIDNYLNETNPPTAEDPVDYNTFTGYTGSTQEQINNLALENPLYAFSKTQSDGTQDEGYGITVTRVSIGTYDYVFTNPTNNNTYGVFAQPFGTTTDTNSQISNVTVNGFRVEIGQGDNGTTPDVLVDTEHAVSVYGVPVSGTSTIPVVSVNTFTGYTATTQNKLDNKLDITGGTITGSLGVNGAGSFGGSLAVGGSITENGIPLVTKYLQINNFNTYSGYTQNLIDNKLNKINNEIIVSVDGNGDFTTIQGAIDSITGASTSNRYLIIVKSGIYVEDVTLKNYVFIEGENTSTTIVNGSVDFVDVSFGFMSISNIAINSINKPVSTVSVSGFVLMKNISATSRWNNDTATKSLFRFNSGLIQKIGATVCALYDEYTGNTICNSYLYTSTGSSYVDFFTKNPITIHELSSDVGIVGVVLNKNTNPLSEFKLNNINVNLNLLSPVPQHKLHIFKNINASSRIQSSSVVYRTTPSNSFIGEYILGYSTSGSSTSSIDIINSSIVSHPNISDSDLYIAAATNDDDLVRLSNVVFVTNNDSVIERFDDDGSDGTVLFSTTNTFGKQYSNGSLIYNELRLGGIGSQNVNEISSVLTGASESKIITELGINNFVSNSLSNVSHSGLLNLNNDDHKQYMLTGGTRPFTGIVSYDNNKTFTGDTNIISKKYVDDKNYNASVITGGTLLESTIPNLDTSKITSGVFDVDRIATGGTNSNFLGYENGTQIWKNVNISDVTNLQDSLDSKLDTGYTPTWVDLDFTSSSLADIETRNSADLTYNNLSWNSNNTEDILDKITEYVEKTQVTGRITPENVINGLLTDTLTVYSGYGFISTEGIHKRIDWSGTTFNLSGFSEGIYYTYVDSNSNVLISLTEPDDNNNIVLGFLYWGGNLIGTLQQCGCIINNSTNSIIDYIVRQGLFIYDNGGALNILTSGTTQIISSQLKTQFGLYDINLSESSSLDATGFTFNNFHKSNDNDWGLNYSFNNPLKTPIGAVPTDIWNNTTLNASEVLTGYTLTFTNNSKLITSTSNLTSLVINSDLIYKQSDGVTFMTPISGVTWTGSETQIELEYQYLGTTGSGTAVLDKSLPGIPTDKWVKHLIVRDTNDRMYLVLSQNIFDSEDDAISGSLPAIPPSLEPTLIKIAYIVVQEGDTDLNGKIYDIRPLPYQFREGGQSGGGTEITQHSQLGGLNSDDHLQYLRTDGSRNLMGIQKYQSLETFTTDLDIPNKKYVDDNDSLNLKLSGGTITGDLKIEKSLYITGTTATTEDLENSTLLGAITIDGRVVATNTPALNVSEEITDVTGNTTITNLSGIYYVDTTLGNVTVSIPDASEENDVSRLSVIKKTDDSNIVIVTTTGGTQNIGNATTQNIGQQDKGLSIIADADNDKWIIVQDSRFPLGSDEGTLLRWNNTNKVWESTTNDVTWDDNDLRFTVGGNSTPSTFQVDAIDDIVYINASGLTGLLSADDLGFYAGGRGAFGNEVTLERLRGNTPSNQPRSLSLIDTNATFRIWRYVADGNDPAVEFIWGTGNTPSTLGNNWWDMFLDGGLNDTDSFAIRRRTNNNSIKALECFFDRVEVPLDLNLSRKQNFSVFSNSTINSGDLWWDGNGLFFNDGTTDHNLLNYPTALTSTQVRRTTTLTLTTSFQNLTFDTTDVQINSGVIEHDTVNTERINIKKDGLYLVTLNTQVTNNAGATIPIYLEVVKNANVLLEGGDSTISVYNADIQQLQKQLIVFLNNGDYIFNRIRSDNTSSVVNIPSTFGAVLLEGATGAQGPRGLPGSGVSVVVTDNGVNPSPTGGSYSTINFTSGATAIDAGDGQTVNIIATGITTPAIKNKFQAVDSVGGQSLNDVTPNPIEWGQVDFQDTDVFTFTAGNSSITVLKTGLYELSFNVNGEGQTNSRSVSGVQFRNNTTAIAPTLTADYARNTSNNDTTNSLPPYLISLTANDVLDVAAFRLGDANANTSKVGASFVRITYLG
jgi:hypothetical protein